MLFRSRHAGAILYELLAGVPAISGESTTIVLTRVLSAEPVALHNLAPDVPPDLEAVIMSALAKSPAVRPSSAREMSARISPFAARDAAAHSMQMSERPMMLTQKKRPAKKKLELVVQSSVPPRRKTSRAPRFASTLKPPKKS